MKASGQHLPINRARKICILHLLLGLLTVRTVNLKEIALACSGKAQPSSWYRRFQRFFATFNLDLSAIARWIFQLFFSGEGKFYVILDRTNGFRGKHKINILMLSIAWEGVAIPILWTALKKAGNSNFEERKTLISRFLRLFGHARIEGLLADREFASGRFFQWLDRKNIPFYIRVKEGSQACIRGKKLFKAKKIFRNLHNKQHGYYGMKVDLFGHSVFTGRRSV
jgi:hypothetical protein